MVVETLTRKPKKKTSFDGNRESDNDFEDYTIPCSRSFVLSITSAAVFVIASVLYVYLEFVDLEYYKKIVGFPDYVLEADDDEVWYVRFYMGN